MENRTDDDTTPTAESALTQRVSGAEESWFDPRLEVRASSIQGQGVFATAVIQVGEQLVVDGGGGVVYSTQDWATGTVRLDPEKYNEDQIDDDLFRATLIDMSYFFNHSCAPNMWGGVAQRVVHPGEEVTTDYALSIFAPAYCLAPCRCGAPGCRQRVTGNDWQRPDLQARYSGHFPPFVQRRLQRLG